MTWTPTDREIESVLNLPEPERYACFVKKAADQEEVWSLWNDGWALASDNSGHQLVPVWPHQRYAALCANEGWHGYIPKRIDLDVWLDRWPPGIKGDHRLIAVFPSPSQRGLLLNLIDLPPISMKS